MKIRIFILSVLTMMLVASCKTNENNYRAAYEVAKEKQMGGVDADTYELMQAESMPQITVINGDSVRVITEAVKIVKTTENAVAVLKNYNVAVAQFRQVFNANAMCRRLSANGYSAYIVENADPAYYVIAGGFDYRTEAVELLKQVQSDKSIVLREPYPCLLQSPYRR